MVNSQDETRRLLRSNPKPDTCEAILLTTMPLPTHCTPDFGSGSVKQHFSTFLKLLNNHSMTRWTFLVIQPVAPAMQLQLQTNFHQTAAIFVKSPEELCNPQLFKFSFRCIIDQRTVKDFWPLAKKTTMAIIDDVNQQIIGWFFTPFLSIDHWQGHPLKIGAFPGLFLDLIFPSLFIGTLQWSLQCFNDDASTQERRRRRRKSMNRWWKKSLEKAFCPTRTDWK